MTVVPDYHRMIIDGEADRLADHAESLLGYPVDPGLFLRSCRDRVHGDPHWSEGTWKMLFKLAGDQFCPTGLRYLPREMASGVFHLGFVSVVETEEHVDRLRNEPVAWKGSPTRSRISKTNEVINPIDIVSVRVVYGDRKKKAEESSH